MIALTQEQREELANYARERLASHVIHGGCSDEEDILKIALASLTADPSGYRWFHEGSSETRGWYADCFPLDNDYLEKCLADKSIHSYESLFTAPPVPDINEGDYFSKLVKLARERAEKAISKFPQPNYVLNKVAEESGEVIKAVIHFTEGRETWENVEGELIDNLAMLIRLVIEGDGIIGFNIPEHIKRLNGLGE